MLRKYIIAVLFALFAVAAAQAATKRNFVLVIDPGHGGRDTGAAGATSKEKNLTLKYALAFGKMVEQNCQDVTVVYTRKTDRFLELWQRAEIANKQKADLFVSVHINSLPKGHTARGFQTYTLGRGRVSGSNKGYVENLEVAKRENAVILLEQDYKQRYQGYDPNSPESDIMFEFIQDDNMERSVELARLMQRNVCAATGRKDMGAHQDNLAVLRLTSMPGCLVELGFISTRDEEQFLNTADAVDRYARGMFNAFVAYKKARGWKTAPKLQAAADKPSAEPAKQSTPASETAKPSEAPKPSKQAEAAKPAEPVPAPQPLVAQQPTADAAAPVFKVQFMTSDRHLKGGNALFKGLTDVDCYKEGALWKYTVGASADYNEILRLRREVAKKFPQAFVIAFKNGSKMDIQEAQREYKSNKK